MGNNDTAQLFNFNSKWAGKTINEGLVIDGLRCSLSLGKTSLDEKSESKEFEILSVSSHW